MRTRLWVAGLASGAVAAVLLGISMLAAAETTEHAATGPDLYLLESGVEKAFASVFVPPGLTRTVNVPCVGKQRIDGSQRLTISLILIDRRSNTRQAHCLHRRGFLDARNLALVLGTRPPPTRRWVARAVPLSLQLEPSALALSSWGALLTLELVGVLVFTRAPSRRGRQSTP